MEKKLKWQNLKRNLCPSCNKDFMEGLLTYPDRGIYEEHPSTGQVLVHPCGFKIREFRYRQIVASQITNDLEKQLDQEQTNE